MTMRHLRLVAIGLVGAAISAGGSSAQTRPAPAATPAVAPAGNADTGKVLYRKTGCYQCHSEQAQGGTQGPRLGPNPVAYRAFSRYLRAPTGEMPPYSVKVMSDQDVADVYAFLRALPPAPPLSSLRLLQP
jgi:ubiquinol-cytochrome c reductase cytochrome c subunit